MKFLQKQSAQPKCRSLEQFDHKLKTKTIRKMNFSHIKTLASGNVLVKFQFSAVIMAKITHIFACVKILVPNPVDTSPAGV